MRALKILSVIFLAATIISCGNNNTKKISTDSSAETEVTAAGCCSGDQATAQAEGACCSDKVETTAACCSEVETAAAEGCEGCTADKAAGEACCGGGQCSSKS